MQTTELGTGRLTVLSPLLCALTQRGRRRENEDDFYLAPDGRLWIVADGMGGQTAGALAAAISIEAMLESLSASAPAVADRPASMAGEPDPGSSAQERLARAFGNAQRRVLEHAATHPECEGMGCAALAVVLERPMLHLCYAGDVRCYVVSARTLTQITHDHTLPGTLVRLGWLTPQQARAHPERSRLDQAVGHAGAFRPESVRRVLEAGDRVLLCTDGVWEAVDESDLLTDLTGTPVTQAAERLVARAARAGGQDNMTVVVYEHS
jgi:protein phosphatase